MNAAVPVIAAPLIDPGQARRSLSLPQGLSLAQMAERAFPGLRPSDMRHLRIVLVSDRGAWPIEARYWTTTRPRPGVRVVIRMLPGKDALRSVLMVVVQVAALALAGPLAGALGIVSDTGIALVGAGLTVVGALLVNALVPMPEADAEKNRQSYRITGWANEVRPDEPVPDVFGRHRTAPPFAATSYTEIVGNQQYVRALFCVGMGPLKISDIRLGETSIDEYDEVEMEIREGRPDDDPITLYPRQVLEEAEGIELVRPQPRDDAGEVIPGPATETPVVRQTAADTQQVNLILAFPRGLFAVDDKGRQASRQVSVRIRQRLAGDPVWQVVATLDIMASSRDPIYRQHSWQLPVRGKWDIEVTRMTDDSSSANVSDLVQLAAIQSIRPEYPLNMDKPLALIALRIRATYQLSGALDNLNCIAQRYALRWDGTAWTEGLPRNPAAAYVAALQGTANPFPATDAEIDWEELLDWYQWCEEKGLSYDRVVETGLSLGDLLREICGAGRATPRHDGLRWSVSIDRPGAPVIDHISPRNSAQFSWQRTYFEPPHGFRVTFFDETNDFKQAERIVPWPGHDGPITLTEEIRLPGKTSPREIWIEARRRMYELIYRADSFTATQSGIARLITRGDQVMGSFDVLDRSQIAARVLSVTGRMIELDESVPAGADGIRFRLFADEEDLVGSSIVQPIRIEEPETRVLTVPGDGPVPGAGDLVHLGPLNSVSLALRVKGVEAAQNTASILHMVAAAPEIDELTDAEVPDDWSGRVGTPIVTGALVPDAPRIVSITSRAVYSGGGEPGQEPEPAETTVEVMLRPGQSPVALQGYRVEHRAAPESAWTSAAFTSAEGGGRIAGYLTGTAIELRAVAVAVDGTESAATATLPLIVGGGANQLPPALDPASVMVTGGPGHAVITLAMPAAPASQVQLFRVPYGAVLDRVAHALPQPVTGAVGSSVSYVDGDATRQNLLSGFDGTGWVPGPGWSLTGDVAQHAPGSAGDLSQALSLEAGATYRLSLDLATVAAGAITPKLIAPAPLLGDAVAEPGLAHQQFVAPAGASGLALDAPATFDGSLSRAVLYRASAAAVSQGRYAYYAETRTDEGLPGPLAGPFSVTIL